MSVRRTPVSILTLVSLLTTPGVAAAPGPAPDGAGAERRQTGRNPRDQLIGTSRLAVRPSMLADNIESLAGREVTVLNARVVGVFEPHAFLIESATRDPESAGHRDRILVLLEDATLRVSPDVLVASTVNVVGVARSLLGMQISAEAKWPAQLDRERVDRLDVRCSVLATSVQTLEGIELTERRSAGSASGPRLP